jgi:hypothetical protein
MANSGTVLDTRRVRGWLIVLLLVAAPAAAERRLVIEEPGMYYACPKGKSWDDVRKCLDKQGRPAIVKQTGNAKLVRLDQLENGTWVDGGVYLYVEYQKRWKIAGSFFGRGTDYELGKLEPLTVGKHTGYRIELAQASPLYVQLDGLTTQRATRRVYQTMFCSAQGSYCMQATRVCEVLVHGGAYWTFRGAMKLEGNEVTIRGDRKNAGPFCAQAERVYLGWPQI